MRYRTRTYYTDARKALMWERWKQGWTLHQIAQLFDRAHTSVRGVLAQNGGFRPPRRSRSAVALTLPEREEISRAMAEGLSIHSIGGRRPQSAASSDAMVVAQPIGLAMPTEPRMRGLAIAEIPIKAPRGNPAT